MEGPVKDGRRIAMFLGDRYGVGPEIVAGYLAAGPLPDGARFIVLGDRRVLEQGARPAEAELPPPGDRWSLLDQPADADVLPLGRVSEASGREMLAALDRICDLVGAGEIDAASTARSTSRRSPSPAIPQETTSTTSQTAWGGAAAPRSTSSAPSEPRASSRTCPSARWPTTSRASA